MPRIIEQGKQPSETLYIVRCHACHSKIEFKSSEGTFVPDSRDGDYMEFKCPVCQGSITHYVINKYGVLND